MVVSFSGIFLPFSLRVCPWRIVAHRGTIGQTLKVCRCRRFVEFFLSPDLSWFSRFQSARRPTPIPRPFLPVLLCFVFSLCHSVFFCASTSPLKFFFFVAFSHGVRVGVFFRFFGALTVVLVGLAS